MEQHKKQQEEVFIWLWVYQYEVIEKNLSEDLSRSKERLEHTFEHLIRSLKDL